MKRKPAWLKKWKNTPKGLVGAGCMRHDPLSGTEPEKRRDGETASADSPVRPFADSSQRARGQSLDGDNLQDVLDSGVNAWRVGRQQFFTPPDLASTLMLPLPMCRVSFVDFQMGAGALLRASGARDLYGIDIDSRLARKPTDHRAYSAEAAKAGSPITDHNATKWHCVNADLTRFYPLLQEIDWRFDLCGLNPPFSVRWHKETLIGLVDSQCDAVRETFGGLPREITRNANLQPTTPTISRGKPTIDSVLATYLIALDRMTERGEGFLICSEACAKKIMETPAGEHVWLWVTIKNESGNQEAKSNVVFGPNVRPFDVAVIYFARAHRGLEPSRLSVESSHGFLASRLAESLTAIGRQRQLLRKGISIYQAHDFCPITLEVWQAAKEEWLRLQRCEAAQARREGRGDFNIWLRDNGTIGRHLTPFQSWSGKIPRGLAENLNRLAGQSPMSLVVQKTTRLALLEAIGKNATAARCPWRVDPALVAAVERAVTEYNAQRAPFYPLNEVQRLGYLDEEDMIMCKRDGLAGFKTGERYALSSETVDIEHHDERLNLLGDPQEITLHGKELAFYIVDELGDRHTFCGVPPDHIIVSKGKGRDASTTITAHGESHGHYHDLQMLIRHFEIPQVPDVAQNNPDRYEAFVNQIRAIEDRVNLEARKPGIAA